MDFFASLSLKSVFEIAFPLFLIMDPIGNSALCLSMLRDQPRSRQRMIILRELLFALAVIFIFQYLGEGLMALLDIHQSTLRIAGGVILFMISVKMVFPSREGESVDPAAEEPFFVPIAVPLIAGPSLLAAVMLYAHRDGGGGPLSLGILLAWSVSAAIMLTAQGMTKLLGKRGMRAAERLMGLILVLLSVQMLEDGVRMFLESF